MRILFLDLDTLRPDHLGCYGYMRDTSPNIDSIAADGVRFTGYHCSDAPCLPSRAALFSGRFGIHNGAVGHGDTCGDMRIDGFGRDFRDYMADHGLIGSLRKAGYRTVSVSPFAERHGSWWFYAGFNEMHNTGKCGNETAGEIAPVAEKWLRENAKEDNWLLHVNFWDPHTPYRAPESFGNPFAEQPYPDWLTDELVARHRSEVHPHGAREIDMFDNIISPAFPRMPGEVFDAADARRMFDGYDCGIRHMDETIGGLLNILREAGVYEETAIIVTSDHGENLGELGLYAEHATADAVTCNIPMIIRWPGVTKSGHVDDSLHYNIDLLPTLAQLHGVQPHAWWDGESYLGALRGEKQGREELVLSQCAHVCQRSARFGDWLYMRTVHDGFHLTWPREMLFNLKDDPHETQDLAAQRPDLCAQGAKIILDWQEEQMLSSNSQIDPMWTVMREGGPFHSRGYGKQYSEYLRQTEREHWLESFRQKHPEEF
ncbi:MAG: sulfatase [Eubacteriales bacterium]|nr:sulfatase [Eubacteriales bacterium]